MILFKTNNVQKIGVSLNIQTNNEKLTNVIFYYTL